MRGASALQSAFDDTPDVDLSVFVVWESVLRRDLAPPTSGVLGRITDTRAAQFWDRECLLSGRIIEAAAGDPPGVLGQTSCSPDAVVWDWVALYPPGVRWDGAYPPAAYAGAPVLRVIDDFRRELASVTGSSVSSR